MMAPNSVEERALTGIVRGLDAYVQLLQERKEQLAGDDAKLMATVVTMTRAALNLTEGPLGRLSADLLRQKLREIAGIDIDSPTVLHLHDAQASAGGDAVTKAAHAT